MKNNRNETLLISIACFALGVITGLFTAKKAGKELKKDAGREMKKVKVRSQKGIDSLKKNMKTLKDKFTEDGSQVGSRISDTFKTIKAKTADIGDSVENLIKRS